MQKFDVARCQQAIGEILNIGIIDDK